MSDGAAVEFQDMILARLKGFAAVSAIVGARVIDGPLARGNDPQPDTKFPCVTMGDSSVIPDDEDCVDGREDNITLDCWTREGGKLWQVRQLADAVRKALHDYEGSLATERLVDCRVTLVRCFRDPDGITSHGVVNVRGLIEEQ